MDYGIPQIFYDNLNLRNPLIRLIRDSHGILNLG